MKTKTLEKLKKQLLALMIGGQKSLTEISFLIGRNHYATVEVLDSLEAEGKIKKTIIKRFTFYELNKEVGDGPS